MISKAIPIIQRRQISPTMIEITCHTKGCGINFKPGQHFKISLPKLLCPDHKGNTRIFNAVSSPNNDDYLTFAFQISDSGFKKTITQVPIGTTVDIKGPYGMLSPNLEKGTPIVMIGHGIGITPFISLILYAIEEQKKNKIILFYSTDSPYVRDILSIMRENKNIQAIEFSKFNNTMVKGIINVNECEWHIAGASNKVLDTKSELLKIGITPQKIKTEEFAGY